MFLSFSTRTYASASGACPSHSIHQRAAHQAKLPVVGKAARKPPPPPEPFLVHFRRCRAHTAASDDNAPADCRTCEPISRLVHWRQRRPSCTVSIESQYLPRRGGRITDVLTSKDCEAAVAQHARTHRQRSKGHSPQAMLSTASWLHSASRAGAAPAPEP